MSHTSDVRVLHVDDDPDITELVAVMIERETDQLTVESATSASEGLDRLATDDFDCIVSDYDMPGTDGVKFLETVREEYPDLPFILYTGKGSEEVASEAISAGATDYLQKGRGTDQYELLANRIQNAVERYRSQQRAADLDRVQTLTSNINQALIRADSRSEAETRICEIISRSDPYLFAWIGKVNSETNRITPQAMAGVEKGYLDHITVTADDTVTGQGPGGTAVRERRIAVSQNIQEDSEFETWREEALERGYQAVGAIPLEYNDTLYGVLGVYSGRPYAFDDDERELLAELGKDIAHALHSFDVQEQLRSERDRRQALFEDAPSPVIAGEVHGEGLEHRIIDVNDAFEDVFGYESETIIGENIAKVIIPAAEKDRYEEIRTRATAGESITAEVERCTANGARKFLLHIVPYGLEEDHVNGTYCWYTDITKLKGHERKLTALHDVADDLTRAETVEQVCQHTIKTSKEILDFDLSVVSIEDAGTLRPVAVSEDVPPEGTTAMSVNEGISGKTYSTGESFLIDDIEEYDDANPQGPYRSAISVSISDYGVFQAVAQVPAAFDETDLELAELLVNHAESALDRLTHEQQLKRQNERLEQFTNTVSHDLQNPLQVAQGRLELAQDECDSDHLNDIANAHERMEALINDLLTLARTGNQIDETEAVDLSDMIDNCWQTIKTAEATLVSKTDQTIRADSSRLKQLLENLFRNAVEHGGDDVTVTVGDLNDKNGFYVADDGPGISEDERDQVFEVGYTTADDGTGFGLNIVGEIVKAHGWKISVTNSESGGARFEITSLEIAAK